MKRDVIDIFGRRVAVLLMAHHFKRQLARSNRLVKPAKREPDRLAA